MIVVAVVKPGERALDVPNQAFTARKGGKAEFSLETTPLVLSDSNRVIATSKGLGWTDIAAAIKRDEPQERYRRRFRPFGLHIHLRLRT